MGSNEANPRTAAGKANAAGIDEVRDGGHGLATILCRRRNCEDKITQRKLGTMD
jgi:hypothetical protein